MSHLKFVHHQIKKKYSIKIVGWHSYLMLFLVLCFVLFVLFWVLETKLRVLSMPSKRSITEVLTMYIIFNIKYPIKFKLLSTKTQISKQHIKQKNDCCYQGIIGDYKRRFLNCWSRVKLSLKSCSPGYTLLKR